MLGFRSALIVSTGIVCAVASQPVQAQTPRFNVPAQDVSRAIPELARQAGIQIVAPADGLENVRSRAVHGTMDVRTALRQMLDGTGLVIASDRDGVILLRLQTAPVPGSSQQPASSLGDADDNTSEIIVTGTNIRGADPLSPLVTLTSDNLRDKGYTQLDQALEQMPQTFRGAAVQTTNGATRAGTGANLNQTFASGVNLRGLGPGTTLVLLNGERLALSSTGTSVDISAIPLSAISRVEILTDGASATYGSDAIGGVVNIITKDRFRGLETSLRLTDITNHRDPTVGGYVTAGTDWSSGGVIGNVEYERISRLQASDRAFSKSVPGPTDLVPSGEVFSAYGAIRQEIFNTTAVDITGVYSDRSFSNEQNETLAGRGAEFSTGRSRQLSIAGKLAADLGRHWTGTLSAQYAQVRNRAETANDLDTSRSDNQYSIPSAQIKLDGPLFDLSAGDVKVALGAEIRGERYHNLSTTASGVYLPQGDARTVFSVFGELLVPILSDHLVHRLEVDLSARHDHYSDFGSTTNPKIAARLSFTPSLSLSASYGTSFKAPTFVEGLLNRYGYVIDVPDPASPTGSTTTLILDGGNRNLKPEHSRSLSINASYSPAFAAGLRATVGFFDIRFRDRILRLLDEGYFFNVLSEAEELGPLVTLNPTLAEVDQATASIAPQNIFFINGSSNADVRAIADIGYVNAASSYVQGFDIQIAYETATPFGHLTLDTTSSVFTHYDQRVAPNSSLFSILNTTYNPLKFRSKVDLSLESKGWKGNIRLNYAGAYKNRQSQICSNAGGCNVSSWTTVDLSLAYKVPSGSIRPLSGLRVDVGITNLLNASPPYIDLDRSYLTYDPTNASPVGRTFSLTLTKSW